MDWDYWTDRVLIPLALVFPTALVASLIALIINGVFEEKRNSRNALQAQEVNLLNHVNLFYNDNQILTSFVDTVEKHSRIDLIPLVRFPVEFGYLTELKNNRLANDLFGYSMRVQMHNQNIEIIMSFIDKLHDRITHALSSNSHKILLDEAKSCIESFVEGEEQCRRLLSEVRVQMKVERTLLQKLKRIKVFGYKERSDFHELVSLERVKLDEQIEIARNDGDDPQTNACGAQEARRREDA